MSNLNTNATQTFCGKCHHPMHWRECQLCTGICRNDVEYLDAAPSPALTRAPIDGHEIMNVAGKRRTEYDATAPRGRLAPPVAALSIGGQAPMKDRRRLVAAEYEALNAYLAASEADEAKAWAAYLQAVEAARRTKKASSAR